MRLSPFLVASFSLATIVLMSNDTRSKNILITMINMPTFKRDKRHLYDQMWLIWWCGYTSTLIAFQNFPISRWDIAMFPCKFDRPFNENAKPDKNQASTSWNIIHMCHASWCMCTHPCIIKKKVLYATKKAYSEDRILIADYTVST